MIFSSKCHFLQDFLKNLIVSLDFFKSDFIVSEHLQILHVYIKNSFRNILEGTQFELKNSLEDKIHAMSFHFICYSLTVLLEICNKWHFAK